MNFQTIIKLMDIKTLVAGIVPVILGSIYSRYAFGKLNIIYLILLSVAMILIQSATNMINDYFDFKRGADSKEKKKEKALVSGETTPKQVLFIIFIYQLIAFIIGIYIASQTSYYILIVAVIGEIISILYACGPLPISYTPIGEVVSGITMGIGITTTVIYIHSGIFNLNTLFVAVPTAVFIGTILLSNNLSDIEEDRKVGRKTLPILIGIKNSEKLWAFNVTMLLILTFILLVMGIYPIVVVVAVILLFPYKSIPNFLSYGKSIYTKGRTMGLIGQIGIKYHLAVIIGLLISIIFKIG
ncbi:prenyltransferase [Clostridium sp. OS1-26]|uniref:prenyltransferase n=1 Tax=Clostridium sp. OS1-26 TaxID=3070681 RepID=UPI0027DF6AF9|nr:prenyltransferase [Clostridium sp. OS1-26]WML34044.1 prenyltransferase [Clostridium sp. OS1-26]